MYCCSSENDNKKEEKNIEHLEEEKEEKKEIIEVIEEKEDKKLESNTIEYNTIKELNSIIQELSNINYIIKQNQEIVNVINNKIINLENNVKDINNIPIKNYEEEEKLIETIQELKNNLDIQEKKIDILQRNNLYNNDMLNCNLQPIGYAIIGIEMPYYGFINNIVPIFIRQNITSLNLIIKNKHYYTSVPKERDKKIIKLEYFDSNYLMNFRKLKELSITYDNDDIKNNLNMNIINKLSFLERIYLENEPSESLEFTSNILKEVVLKNMKNLKELKYNKNINCHLINCNSKLIIIEV
jgi:hypothetical protein